MKEIKQIIYYKNLNKKYREKPVEPWAFIRVKNEMSTIEKCLNSILPVIKKGVIGYQKLFKDEIDDGTEKFILEFCRKNKGFIPYKYEYEVIPANDKRYLTLEKVKKENRLDSFYNAVLEQIPKDEWLIKIDCDHIYDTEKLRNLMYLPQKENDVISFSRFNLHYLDDKLYVLKNNYIVDPGDHWLIKNKDINFKFKTGNKKGKFYAWEQINLKEKLKNKEVVVYHTDLFNWHFPFLKNSRSISKENLIEFKDFKFTILDKLCYHISKDMYDEVKILTYLNNI